MATTTKRRMVQHARVTIRQQFHLLVNHVQRLQDTLSVLVRRMPQLTQEHDDLQNAYAALQAKLQPQRRPPRRSSRKAA